VNSISGFEDLRKKTVRRDLERRLRALEAASRGGFEIWVYQGGELVRGPQGELLTREEAESRCRAAGMFAFFCTESDMLL